MGWAQDGRQGHKKKVLVAFLLDSKQHLLSRAGWWQAKDLLSLRTVQVRHAPLCRRESQGTVGSRNVSTLLFYFLVKVLRNESENDSRERTINWGHDTLQNKRSKHLIIHVFLMSLLQLSMASGSRRIHRLQPDVIERITWIAVVVGAEAVAGLGHQLIRVPQEEWKDNFPSMQLLVHVLGYRFQCKSKSMLTWSCVEWS